MATNSKIGKKYTKNRPSNVILPRSKRLSVQSIKNWKDALTLAQLPDNKNKLPLLQIYDSILIDSHLQSILESRILRILGSKFKFINKAGEENKELNNLFKKKWFNNFLSFAMWSRFLGASVVELWDLNEFGELAYCGQIPRENTLTKKGLIIKEVGEEKGYLYKEGALKNYYIQIGENEDLGLLAKAAPDALTKKFAKAAWSEYVEKYGIPPRVVTTDSHNDKRGQELADMLQQMVSNHWVVLQGNEKLEMMNMQGVDAYATFDNLIKRMNSEMSKRILGQDGTTDSSDTKGTYGSLKVLEGVADDRHNSDKSFIEYLINDELLWRLELISPAYSELKSHRFEWDDTKELTPVELIDMVSKMNSAGYIVDSKYIEEKTSLPIIGRIETPPPNNGGEKKKNRLSLEYREEITCLYSGSNNLNITASVDPLKKPFLGWARKIFYNDDAHRVDWSLLDKTVADLLDALKLEDEKVKASAGFEDRFYASMASNLYVFSAAKSFAEYQELNELLTDENGKPRDWQKFKDRALELHCTYNVNYLKTEYNQALRTAQMAGKWRQFEKMKDLYDLQFDTAGDSKVRKAHAKLDRITRPVNDNFWDKYYPPIDWNCRCSVRQVAKGTPITPEEKMKGLPKVPKQFQFNAGKQGFVFTDDHPYIKNLFNGVERELQSVKDYGLKRGVEIYAEGKNLIKPLKKLVDRAAAEKWFDKTAEKGTATFDAYLIGKKVKVSLTKERMTKHIFEDHPEDARWLWIHNLPKILQGADEVYLVNYKERKKNKKIITYRFISFFEDIMRVVNVNQKFEIVTVYETEIIHAESQRQGFLLYAKK